MFNFFCCLGKSQSSTTNVRIPQNLMTMYDLLTVPVRESVMSSDEERGETLAQLKTKIPAALLEATSSGFKVRDVRFDLLGRCLQKKSSNHNSKMLAFPKGRFQI